MVWEGGDGGLQVERFSYWARQAFQVGKGFRRGGAVIRGRRETFIRHYFIMKLR